MKKNAFFIYSLLAFFCCLSLFIFSCTASNEKKADHLLKQGKKDRAYRLYQQAIFKDNESPTLREKFLKLTLEKAEESIEELDFSRTDLYVQDIDEYIKLGVEIYMVEKYVNMLITLADTLYGQDSFMEAFNALQKAVKLDSFNIKLNKKLKSYNKKYYQIMLKTANEYYADARKYNNPEAYIGAEYYTLCAVKYNPKSKKARQLLGKIRRKNINTYSIFRKVVEEPEDDINKYDIYLSVTDEEKGKKTRKLKAFLYNDSYNPVNIGYDHFYAVGASGKKYQALKSSGFPKKLLDAEYEVQGILKFSMPRKERIAKLVFEDIQEYEARNEDESISMQKDEHIAEKFFY